MLRLRSRSLALALRRASSLNKPAPPKLPRKEQKEFEELQKQAAKAAAERNSHSLYRKKYEEFEGNKNPITGEINGPKQDPLRHGDYSFNGRVTDF